MTRVRTTADMLFNLYFQIGWNPGRPETSSPMDIERAIRWATGWLPNNMLFVPQTLDEHPSYQKAIKLAVGEKMSLGTCYTLERTS